MNGKARKRLKQINEAMLKEMSDMPYTNLAKKHALKIAKKLYNEVPRIKRNQI